MGFSANRYRRCGANSITVISTHARPMGASSPTSKAGTRFRKPTAFLALTGGIGRQLNPAASSHGKTVAHSSPSILPGYGFQCGPKARPSFEKVTDRVKAVAPRPVRCTTRPLRLQKPMPPNGRWRLSEDRSGLSFIAGKRTHRCSGR